MMCSLDSRRWMSAPIRNNAANSIDSISNLPIDVKLSLWCVGQLNVFFFRDQILLELVGIAAVPIFLESWKSREMIRAYATCDWARHVILDLSLANANIQTVGRYNLSNRQRFGHSSHFENERFFSHHEEHLFSEEGNWIRNLFHAREMNVNV